MFNLLHANATRLVVTGFALLFAVVAAAFLMPVWGSCPAASPVLISGGCRIEPRATAMDIAFPYEAMTGAGLMLLGESPMQR